MATTNINIQTDSEVKSKAQEILSDLGLDMSTAFNIFLRQIINREGIPFPVTKTKTPSLGGWEGKIWMSDDFDAPIDDFKEYME